MAKHLGYGKQRRGSAAKKNTCERVSAVVHYVAVYSTFSKIQVSTITTQRLLGESINGMLQECFGLRAIR